MPTNISLKFTDYPQNAAGGVGTVAAHTITWASEQVLNIGSQSSGAGAGRVSFLPLEFTKDVDTTSSLLFLRMCSGTPWKALDVTLRRAGTAGSGDTVLQFGLVAVKDQSVTIGPDGVPIETVTLEYGQQVWQTKDASGKPVVRGWDRVRNVAANALLTG